MHYYLKISFFLLLLSIFSCKTDTYHQGKILYENFCQNCHMEDGTGLKNIIPPLANSDYLKNNQKSLVCLIRHGINDSMIVNGKLYNQAMPANLKLKEGDITNIINYINNSWGNNYGIIQYSEVIRQYENCRNLPNLAK